MYLLYSLLFLLFVLFVLVLILVFLVGPILAVLAYWRQFALRRRLDALEAEVERLRGGQPVEPAPAEEVLDALPATETIRPTPAEPSPVAPTPSRGEGRLEGVLGRQVLGWTAVGLLLLASSYFLKYAFDNGWVGPLGQVSLGILGGVGLCVAGYACHRRGHALFAQMLSAAGVAILYLSVFASFGYYHLLPMSRAGLYLAAVVALTAALAVAYPARGIAALALVGGLSAPLLLTSDRDPYVGFFVYLALLDLGLLAMSLLRGWLLLAPLGLLGIQSLFWGWAAGAYHPEKLTAVLLFQAAIYLFHTAHDVLVPVLARRLAHPLQLLDLVGNGFALGLALTAFLHEEVGPLLPTLAVGVAILYALQSRVVQTREPIDARLQLTLVALGFGFLAVACALRLEAGWIGVGWAVEGLALWWYGLRVRSVPMRSLASVLLVLATFQVLFGGLWGPYPAWTEEPVFDPLSPAGRFFAPALFVPVFNRFAFPGLVVAVCLLAAAWLARTMLGAPRGTERTVWVATVLGGIGLGLVVLSNDVYRFVRVLELRQGWSPYEAISLAGTSVSVLWAVYAGLVLAVGFWRDSPTVRYVGLGLFGLAVLKALLVDSAQLEGFYRVLAFFVLAAVMGLGAWTYQRLERAHREAAREVVA